MAQKNISNSDKLDFEKVWFLFQETSKKFDETSKKFEETKMILEQSKLETDRQLQQTDRQLQDTDRQVKKLMKKMSEVESRWGKFVESLVDGALVRILNQRNIKVDRTLLREKRLLDNKEYEIDIIAKNGSEIVAVEVKTTLGVQDVKDFLEKLKSFKTVFHDYSNNTLFGAVAYVNVESEADKFAMKNGLLVIKASGESAKISNTKDFIPKQW